MLFNSFQRRQDNMERARRHETCSGQMQVQMTANAITSSVARKTLQDIDVSRCICPLGLPLIDECSISGKSIMRCRSVRLFRQVRVRRHFRLIWLKY
jgi:hypothetical protein